MVNDLFDRKLLRFKRSKVKHNFLQYNFLHHEIANRLYENFVNLDVKIDSLLEIESFDGYLSSLINCKNKIISDFDLRLDEEFLPFKSNCFDMIASNLNMHFINNVVKFLQDLNSLLKRDGVVLISFFGEENLKELSDIIFRVESKKYGGVSPRMAPRIDIKTAGMLFQKCGFDRIILDVERIEVEYDDPIKLLKDIKMMGQGNFLIQRSKKFITKSFLQEFENEYKLRYDKKATFEIITAIARKPALKDGFD